MKESELVTEGELASGFEKLHWDLDGEMLPT